MRLSDLQLKNIVCIEDGKIIGTIIDVLIDEKGNMNSLIVQKSKFFNSFLKSSNEIEIKWNQIKKIGTDVILISMTNLLSL